MAIITSNNGAIYQFNTAGSAGTSITQIAGTEYIFPTAFYNNVIFSAGAKIETDPSTIVHTQGPLIVNAITPKVRRITASSSPTTHSIGDLEIWSGSYTTINDGGSALQCTVSTHPILFDFTSSISSSPGAPVYGIPHGTIITICHASTASNAGITLTGSFNMWTTQSLSCTDIGCSIMLMRIFGGSEPGGRWNVLSQQGNWIAT